MGVGGGVEAVSGALAPFGFPRGPGPGLGFTAADDARFAAGHPELRTLTDEPMEPEEAAATAERALDAIDPMLRHHVPRDLARRQWRAFAVRVRSGGRRRCGGRRR